MEDNLILEGLLSMVTELKEKQEAKAHIIGPCIAGAPNDYPEMNAPWHIRYQS